MSRYRRIQLARYLIDGGLARADALRLRAGRPHHRLRDAARGVGRDRGLGRTVPHIGVHGADGEVACNRPFANSRPGPHLRNYPFPPAAADLRRIRLQLRAHLDL